MSLSLRTRTFKTSGIVLRTRELAEQDRFITLYTPDQGKLTCIAKGIRSFKSRRSTQVELLSRVDIQLWKSNHHFYLTQAISQKRFSGFKEDMASLTSGVFIAELVDRLTPDEQPHKEIFDLLDETFSLMEFYPEHHELLREAFVIKCLQLLGILGSVRQCGQCREPLPAEAAYLDEFNLTLHCRPCTENEPHKFKEAVHLETLKLIHFILEHRLLGVLNVKMEESHLAILSQFGRLFLATNLHHPLKSEAFLNHY